MDTTTATNTTINDCIGLQSNTLTIGNAVTVSDYNSTYQPLTASNWTYTIEPAIYTIPPKEKEKEKMKIFGPYSNNNIRLSPYGIAIRDKQNRFVSYDKINKRIINVDIFNIEIDSTKLFYKLPKPINDINIGDTILHNDTPMFVEELNNKRITAIDPVEGVSKIIVPAVSPFNYDYITTIMSLNDYLPQPDENNPFGSLLYFSTLGDTNNILPFLLLQKDKEIDPLLLATLSNNNIALYMLLQEKMSKFSSSEEK